jgi:large subunit ribosomal protein L30
VSDKTHMMIRIKWVGSGIGFTYRQKMIVRSLGLRRLNQTVVRPDTPQIRGIVAAVPHLVEIVPEAPAPWWASVPEYTVYPPEVVAIVPSSDATGTEAASDVTSTTEVDRGEALPATEGETEEIEKAGAEKVKPAKGAKTKSEPAGKKARERSNKVAKAVKK